MPTDPAPAVCPYCLTRCGHPDECGAELDEPETEGVGL